MREETKHRNSGLDHIQKYVGIIDDSGPFVEFNFAIGDPALFVELVLPKVAFDDFCIKNKVQRMTSEDMASINAEAEKWRFGNETLVALNKR